MKATFQANVWVGGEMEIRVDIRKGRLGTWVCFDMAMSFVSCVELFFLLILAALILDTI